MATENKRIIFLVDDEPIQNEMLKDYLSDKFLYDIKTFSTGEEAMKQMGENPDILVLDYHLSSKGNPTMNGIDILRQIKEKSPDTQVIMLSGQDKIQVAVDSMKNGAYDYVIKGETAFARIENVINNASELRKARLLNKAYKRTITVLTTAFIVVVIISLLLVRYNH